MDGSSSGVAYANPSLLSESLLPPTSYNRSTVDLRASSLKARRTARRQMVGSHLDDCAKMERDQLSSRLVSYRAMYLATGAYCSCTTLITPLFRQFMKDKNSKYTDEFTLLIQAAWAAKPLFAFLSDWIFPFQYRIKGYIPILAFINALLAIIGAVHVQRLETSDGSLLPFQAFTFLIFVNLAFVDSICQGMTTITLRLEQRLVAMDVRNTPKSPSLIKNYMSYLIVRQIAGSIYLMLASYLMDKSSCSTHNIAVAFVIVAVLSFGCAFQSLLFFSEFKQSGWSRRGTTLTGQFKKFKSAVIQDGGHVLLLFAFLMQINPYSSIQFDDLYQKVGQSLSKTVQLITEPISSTFLAILMIYLVMKRVKYFNRSIYYVSGFYLLEMFVLALNYWSWPAPPSQLILVIMFILQTIYSDASQNASLVLVIQSVAKYCEEGVESFSINMVTCSINLGGLLSSYTMSAIQDKYLSGIESVERYETIVTRLLISAMGITILFGLINFFTVLTKVPQNPEPRTRNGSSVVGTFTNSTLRE